MQLYSLKNRVTAAHISESKFRANLLTVRFLLPLSADTVTENAMAAELICSCSKAYPKQEALNLKLMQLYGATFTSTTEKIGNSQMITLRLHALKNGLGINGENCFFEALELVRESVFNPNAENFEFPLSEVNRVKAVWCDKINAEINNKRIYAKNRLEQIMFEGEPYGVPRYGFIEKAKNASGKELYSAYLRLINEAQIRITYIGDNYPEQFINQFTKALPDTKRYSVALPTPKKSELREVTERINISQGKLCMGFNLKTCGEETETYPIAVAVDIFGGGTYSKLFSEVRERMGLCYYCSAHASRYMGLMLVESGVDEQNAKTAKQEILNQLESLKQGDFSDETLEASKRSYLNSLGSVEDSIVAIDSWYGSRMVQKNPLSPKELAELINSLSRKQVISAANGITPDTFFYLFGEEEINND